ncbi:[Pyruvate dehydrogenase (acetyl-transferring)] kinase [Durusdinium trenchii]|uniref:Protein-serine/threonine kinase n=1 Tax=Durusdinium trenchii TaxID=1381693 RepID=A0ABP0NX27_9DINO
MGLVVVLGGSHALGAPKELVRQREALASKRRAPEAPCVVLSLKAPDDTRRRRTGETDRRRSALQLPQEERQMGEAEIHGEQAGDFQTSKELQMTLNWLIARQASPNDPNPDSALLFPRPKRRAREERLHEFLQAEVVFFASREPMLGKSITLRQILDAKTPEQAANLAYRELPIRYAQRILQIEALPEWQASRELVEVHRLYSENFKDIRLVELDVKELEPFTEVIETIKGRMKEVIPMLATAMRNLQWADGYSEAAIVQWLDAFFLSRIGTEMLTSQYMASAKPDAVALRRRRVGVVDFACDPVNICEQAARHARKLVKQHYDESADVEIVVESGVGGKSSFEIESRIRFPYVPNYLFYIMVELLKNSARATVEAQQENPGQRRPIVITVGADRREVAIRVWDQAGGIPFHAAEKVWSYMYSTASKAAREFDEQGTPLAGYGVGLPLSRLYARYLGGALYLQSMPGVGTCAYLYLKRLESEAREELPERSSVSSCSLV